MSENKESEPVQESTSFICKVCGKKNCRVTEKSRNSERVKRQWCSNCWYDLEYQQDRAASVVKRLEDVLAKITFDEVRADLVEKVAKVLKSN